MTPEAVLGTHPSETLRPTTISEAVEVVRATHAAGKAVLPWGSGTGQDYGYLPRQTDCLLDLSGLNRVVAHAYADMTVTVEAGVTLAQLRATLSEHDQFLPFLPADEEATVGGVLATDAYGSLRLGYGTARDWLIGVTVIDGQGRLIHGGGKVVKNVTGYDLPKLHIGALGTLGIIAEATFKVAPKPAAARTLVAAVTPNSQLKPFSQRLWKESSPVSILLHDDDQGSFLVAIYHGAAVAVDELVQRGHALALECGLSQPTIYEGELGAEGATAPLMVRLEGKPADTAALHASTQDALIGSGAVLDTLLGVGAVTVAWPADSDLAREGIRKARALAQLLNLRCTVLHAPAELRQGDNAAEPVWWPTPASLPLQQRLKRALDPSGTLNPGRFIGGL